MRWIKRALWGLMCFSLVPAMTAHAGTYSARIRWQPSSDPNVTGYRVYSRTASGSFGAGQDAGKPTKAPDGSMSFEIASLNVEGDYTFAVSVYTASAESSRSNERTLGYAQVAALVDSDGDGLTDGQEDLNLNRMVDPGESDPDDPDSDDDGRGDAIDICEGTAAGAAVNGQGCSCAQIAPCNNGNACDGVETCVAGVCQPGTAPNCNDGNACTTDTCNVVQGCLHTAVPGCAQCGSAADCNDNNACTTDSCNAGTCVNQARANGTACGDANVCNGAETCQSGVCAAGQRLDCNDGNACTTDSCNATSGCANTVKSDGSSCTDGNACNGAETCQGGSCTGGTPLTCNDVNPCTSDSCNPASGCTFTNKADGASCADGNQCNGGETCNDGDACTADTCDPAKGCTYAPLASCTGCATSADCNDDNPCTADACTSGTCTNTVRADGTSCSDGLFCTVGETCVAGACGGGTANCQSQKTACKNASCDEARRTCVTEPLANGTVCGEPDGCSTAPTCQYGACTASAVPPCDDGNPCTADACDPAGGCSHTPVSDGTTCADRNFCDGVETCQAGVCVDAAAPECDDGNSCTIDYCDGRRRRCSHTGASSCCASDEECADDDLCTINERCTRGRCVSDPVVCTSGGRCDLTTCDPTLGCQVTPLPDGSSCDDGDPCTGGETCRSGECVRPQTAAVEPAAAGGGETLLVQKFTLKPAGRRGTRLSARGSFPSSAALDVGAGEVKLEVRDAEGSLVYSATVPGTAFVPDRGGTRLLYWIPDRATPVYNGLQKLLLTTNDGTIGIVAKGLIPPSDDQTVPAALAARAGRTSSSSFDDTTLAWAMHLFNGCVSDPTLECKKWRRWFTWCR